MQQFLRKLQYLHLSYDKQTNTHPHTQVLKQISKQTNKQAPK